MKSSIYLGRITHTRLSPVQNHFVYPVYVYAFDLDELEHLDHNLRLFGYNRFRPISLFDRDYLHKGSQAIREKINSLLERSKIDLNIQRIVLVTAARFFGYIFNPVSFYYCYRNDDSLGCVVAEVNNTFHERHLYVLDPSKSVQQDANAQSERARSIVQYHEDKEFYVSPFYDCIGVYEFAFAPLNDQLDIRLDLQKEGKKVFHSRIWGKAMPLKDRNLLRLCVQYPLRAWSTIPRIYWQAAKLHYGKQLPILSKPHPVSENTIRVAAPSWFQAQAQRLVFQYLRSLQIGQLTIKLPDGQQHTFGQPESSRQAWIDVRSYAFFSRLVLNGDIGFGEGYTHGDWDSPDLLAVLRLMVDNHEHLNHFHVHTAWLSRLGNRVREWLRKNTPQGSQKNISAHYDLSNDFYRLFLDPSMLYSSAIFARRDESLEEAQQNKLDAMIRKAEIQADDHVLEIGTGWGAFAIEAVQQTGCRVTTVTLSHEQYEAAQQRVQQAGLQDRIDIRLCDYRELDGQYDKIVSIEMIEAVGAQYYGTFFQQIEKLLKPNGLCVIQAITVPDQRFDAYRREGDWIQKYIFPGGLCPSLYQLSQAMTRHSNLFVENLENIGPHYARTLREWRERFEANLEEVKRLGFDEYFIRTWRYYLLYCEAGFACRILNNLQIVLTRPNNASLASEALEGSS